MWSLPAAQRAIIIAGCLGTAYLQLILSPANVEFARRLGANELHIGILNALPFLMLFMQFLAAVVVNHLGYRRWLWMSLSIVHRLIFVPLTLGVLLAPQASTEFWLYAFLVASAMNHALFHFCSPLWLSWMGDYLPHEGLSHYWGLRQLWLHWSAAAALAVSAVLLYQAQLSILPAFALLCGIGAACGVVDVVLFAWVDEPPVKPSALPSLQQILIEPFQHASFRSFIGYSCYWNFATMIAAPFMSMYLLEQVGMSLYQVLLVWAISWIGGALAAGRMGLWAEQFGHRPVLILCTLLKSVNVLVLLWLPDDPTLAFWIIAPTFMADQVLNSGITIASNGFMLKHSPQENRTMYLAAGVALAGMIGGMTGIAAGAVLDRLRDWSFNIAGYAFGGFQLLFVVSMGFRVGAIFLARTIQEPGSKSTWELLRSIVGQETPEPVVLFADEPQVSPAESPALAAGLVAPGPAPLATAPQPAAVEAAADSAALAATLAAPLPVPTPIPAMHFPAAAGTPAPEFANRAARQA